MEKTIATFDELIEFLKVNDLTPSQVNEIVGKCLRCWFINDLTKEQMIEELIGYWNKWNHTTERPLFIDLEDPLDT